MVKTPGSRRLALFDLDNTLLGGDSDHAWGEFLVAEGLVDEAAHRATNDQFYRQYLMGKLDIHSYVRFAMQPVVDLDAHQRQELLQRFVQQVVKPMIQVAARQLLQRHRQAGDHCVIITATNEFVAAPVAAELGVKTLLSTELSKVDDRLTGEILGTPCFGQGKVERLQQWLGGNQVCYRLDEACFYTDSINDLPLMEAVGLPIAVDPDEQLAAMAARNRWQVISLRS